MMIENGTMFSECTEEQLEWAKTKDEWATNYYIEMWNDPESHVMSLVDPMWYNGKWIDLDME